MDVFVDEGADDALRPEASITGHVNGSVVIADCRLVDTGDAQHLLDVFADVDRWSRVLVASTRPETAGPTTKPGKMVASVHRL
jgi:hypothetical protein